MDQHTIEWLDSGREPRCTPDPAYPDGKDVDATFCEHPSCRVDLPYPAKRCGAYVVTCNLCGMRAACTTAGRPDDPRSYRFHCKVHVT